MTLGELDDKAKVWRCKDTWVRTWHAYVPDTDAPATPCSVCGTWDWSFPVWELATIYVNMVINERRSRRYLW